MTWKTTGMSVEELYQVILNYRFRLTKEEKVDVSGRSLDQIGRLEAPAGDPLTAQDLTRF
ncbi:hypothetical protein [Ruegeria sp. Alg231-54]|uniref:hypothetical protein n=1 Tax=Ruegeria sp. Alg231-54 TaxID=1922221 RepID=UPI00131ED902|nr:hypothetical protein [Ruegeria sp. Alg231-54]